MTREEEPFLDFVSSISVHDCRLMNGLLADNAVLIDERGKRVTGKENIKFLWTGLSIKFPDYRIDLTTVLAQSGR